MKTNFRLLMCVILLSVIVPLLTYCSKFEAEMVTAIHLSQLQNGLSEMDISCANVISTNAGQAAVCASYFNNKGVCPPLFP